MNVFPVLFQNHFIFYRQLLVTSLFLFSLHLPIHVLVLPYTSSYMFSLFFLLVVSQFYQTFTYIYVLYLNSFMKANALLVCFQPLMFKNFLVLLGVIKYYAKKIISNWFHRFLALWLTCPFFIFLQKYCSSVMVFLDETIA